MPLLEAFCFTDRNPQSDSHIKRAVNTLYNNLAFLWVAQLSLLLQWTLSADGYCKCPVKLCSGHLDQHFFSILGFSHPIKQNVYDRPPDK